MNRNKFIKTFLGGALISKVSFGFNKGSVNQPDTFSLPSLLYSYDALEPHIDAMTMEIHHSRHHQAYVTNLNKAIVNTPAQKLTLENILKNISKYPAAVRNNGGGHWNHSFFWKILSPNSTKPSESLLKMINRDFGSFEKFQTEFNNAAATRFGSGWAWVIVQNKKLKICSTPNQDNPLMDIAEVKGKPILGIDVWEHAYYLKYQNKRADYVKAFWNLVNWKEVESLL